MRKAIFLKFIQVLLAALVLNSVIFYIVTSSVMLKDARKQMLYTLETIDQVLDYEADVPNQVVRFSNIVEGRQSQFSVIRMDGKVIADTGLSDIDSLDSHLEREEIQLALADGIGYADRYSKTTGRMMLYVACVSSDSNYLLRLAIPYSSPSEYLTMLLPAIWLSFAIALLVSASVAERFSSSITKPLHEISQEMLKVKGNYTDFHFETYQYPEINVIGETTTEMSQNVKAYLDQIELEKQIRQEFFSNASHELKTPITSIQGYAELLESGMVEEEQMKNDFVRRIKKEAVHMTSLINDILMISRLETKEAEVIFSDVRITLVLEDVMEAVKPMADSLQITLHTDCRPVIIHANMRQMTEMLSNLLSNAVKYNRQGGNVWVEVTSDAREVTILVRDDGVGIPKEALGRIFERFYRVDKGRSRKQGGTGLGLAIVKHIVGFYKGTIQVKSEVDVGTEMIVKLPVRGQERGLTR